MLVSSIPAFAHGLTCDFYLMHRIPKPKMSRQEPRSRQCRYCPVQPEGCFNISGVVVIVVFIIIQLSSCVGEEGLEGHQCSCNSACCHSRSMTRPLYTSSSALGLSSAFLMMISTMQSHCMCFSLHLSFILSSVELSCLLTAVGITST